MSVELQQKLNGQANKIYLLEQKIQALTSQLRDLRSAVSRLENAQSKGYPGYD